MLHDIAVCVT